MNMVCLSINLSLPGFLSRMFYAFQSMFCTPVLEFIPKYFILFDYILNRELVLNFSFRFLQVYNSFVYIDLYIFNPDTLLNLLVLKLLVNALGFYMYKIMPSVNRGSLTYSFPK